jgi:hypothetical protein
MRERSHEIPFVASLWRQTGERSLKGRTRSGAILGGDTAGGGIIEWLFVAPCARR